MHIQFLKSKYHKYMFFKSSSIWHGIKNTYDVVSKNTFWTLGKDDCIDLWNDHLCSDICISKLARISYSNRV